MEERRFVVSLSNLRPAMVAAFNAVKAMTERGAVEVVVRYRKAKRSIEQNRRYWALLREVSDCAWCDGRQFGALAWHEWFKREFIGVEEVPLPFGKILQRGISTTTLNTEDFGNYMMAIEAWCGNEGFLLGESTRQQMA